MPLGASGSDGADHPESAKAFPLPSNNRVRLDVKQRTAPARPQASEGDPNQPIQARQDGTPTFSLKGRKLQSQGSILEGHGWVTAQEQSNETNEGQQ